MDDRWRIEDRDDTVTQPDADSWNNFIASLNPQALEQERVRPPADTEIERPGSAEDTRMRSRHNQVVTAFYTRQTGHVTGPLAPIEALELRLERDIAAYTRRKKHAA
jgi:hypothetical protein